MLLTRTQRRQYNYTDRCGPKRKIHIAYMVREGNGSRTVEIGCAELRQGACAYDATPYDRCGTTEFEKRKNQQKIEPVCVLLHGSMVRL